MDQFPTSWARRARTTELSERVLEAVADATDSTVRTVTPLYDRVDPEAFDDLFGPTRAGARTTAGSGVTRTDCCWVVTRSDGRVDARPRTDPTTPPTRPTAHSHRTRPTAHSHRTSHEWAGDRESTPAILRTLDAAGPVEVTPSRGRQAVR